MRLYEGEDYFSTGLNGNELMRSLALHGVNCIRMRICGAAELARLVLMRSGISISEDFVSAKEEAAIAADAINGEPYFGKTSSSDIQEIAAAIRRMRSLIADEDEEQSVQDKLPTGIFKEMVASCSFQSYEGDCIELGFDVAEQYRKQGIATELVKGMLRTVHTLFSGKPVMIRTNVTNTACRRVAEKCGGVFSGYEPTLAAKAIAGLMESYGNKPTDDEELLKMRQRNAEFIEENKEGVCVYRFE